MSKTVKVRIAVAVDVDGSWAASGWCKGEPLSDEEAKGWALEALDSESGCERVFFLTADLAIPREEEIAATVEAT